MLQTSCPTHRHTGTHVSQLRGHCSTDHEIQSSVCSLSESWKSLIVQPEMPSVYSLLCNAQSPCFWGTHGLRLHKIWKFLYNSWGNTGETAEVTVRTTIKIKKFCKWNLTKAAMPSLYKKWEIKHVLGIFLIVTSWEMAMFHPYLVCCLNAAPDTCVCGRWRKSISNSHALVFKYCAERLLHGTVHLITPILRQTIFI